MTFTIIIIKYIYHALISALSAHTVHINLNMIFYTHVEYSPSKTTDIKYYMETHTHNSYCLPFQSQASDQRHLVSLTSAVPELCWGWHPACPATHTIPAVFLSSLKTQTRGIWSHWPQLSQNSGGVGPLPVQLVDEGQARNAVALHLTVDSEGLALDAAHSTQHQHCTIQHSQGTLHFHCEVHVTCRHTRTHTWEWMRRVRLCKVNMIAKVKFTQKQKCTWS